MQFVDLFQNYFEDIFTPFPSSLEYQKLHNSIQNWFDKWIRSNHQQHLKKIEQEEEVELLRNNLLIGI